MSAEPGFECPECGTRLHNHRRCFSCGWRAHEPRGATVETSGARCGEEGCDHPAGPRAGGVVVNRAPEDAPPVWVRLCSRCRFRAIVAAGRADPQAVKAAMAQVATLEVGVLAHMTPPVRSSTPTTRARRFESEAEEEFYRREFAAGMESWRKETRR